MPSEKTSEKRECDIVALVARAFGLKYATAKTPNLMLYDVVKKLLANGETYFAYFVLASVTESKILPFESLVSFLKHDQMKLSINIRDIQNKDQENSGNQLFFVREFIVELTYTYLKGDNSKGVSKSCFRYFYDTLEYEWTAFPTICEEGTVSVSSVSSQKSSMGRPPSLSRSKLLDINDDDMFGNDNDTL